MPISRAVGRRSVPLKNMCSAKCAIPFVSGVSYREPAASMIMQVTDCTCGMSAVITRSPLPSTCRSNTLMPDAPALCWLADVSWAASRKDLAGRVACSCRQPLAPLVRDGHGLALGVVVADQDALGHRDHPPADA